MKKELDLAQIMRDSIMKANKDLGFLKEQTEESESAFDQEFDAKEHMPSFKLSPKKWGTKGTREAKELDAAIKNLVPAGEKDGLKRFRAALENLNNALGTKFSETGEESFTTYSETEKSSLNKIVSGLMIKNALNSLITDLAASATGTSFEGFVARLAGGYTSNETDKPIEDLVDADGNFISLKTIIGTTPIGGSLPNLAQGIVTSPNNKVIYLVCVKDKESDPFKMRTYSFEINKNNFFKFVTKKQNPTVKDIEAVQAKVFSELSIPEMSEYLTEVAKDAPALSKKELKTLVRDEAQMNSVIKKYFENAGKKDAPLEEFKMDAEKAIEGTQPLTDTEVQLFNLGISRAEEAAEVFNLTAPTFKEKLIEKIFFGNGKVKVAPFVAVLNVFPYMEELLDSDKQLLAFQKSEAGKKFQNQLKSLETMAAKKQQVEDDFAVKFLKDFSNKNNIDDKGVATVEAYSNLFKSLNRKKDFEEQVALAKAAAKPTIKKAEDAFKQSGAEGELEAFKKMFSNEMDVMRKKLGTLVNFSARVNQAIMQTQEKVKTQGEYERDARERSAAEISPQEKETSEKLQSIFFQRLSNFYSLQEESLTEAKGGVSSQFEVSQNLVKDFVDSYSVDYPQIVVEKRRLFDSAEENAKQFKDWAEPIYRGMHYLTQGINQYFIEDRPSGLKTAEDRGVKEVQRGITQIGGVAASELGKEKAQQQTESKKTSLNDDFLNDILEDLI